MDELNALLSRVGGWKSVAFAAAALVVVVILKKLLSAPKEDPHLHRVACACGWAGAVSRHKPRCPKCGRSDAMREA